MIKKSLLLVVLFIATLSNAQILHIPQTLECMNKLLLGNKKVDNDGVEFYQTLTLDGDILNLKYIDSNFSYEMDTNDLLVDLVSAKGNWFRVRNKVKGIVVHDTKTNKKSIRHLERIYINDADEAAKNRFAVAFKYLIRLIKEQKSGKSTDVENKMQPKFINLGEKDRVTVDVDIIDDKHIIEAEVCGTNKKFILDYSEFASTISLEAEYDLLEKHIITKRNYLKTVLYKYKNGKIRMSRQVIIPEIKIGDFKVLNSHFFIAEDDSSDLTLGKSFLNYFGEWDVKRKSRKHKTLTLHIK